MSSRLSYTMLQALSRIGEAWTDVSYFISWPTLDALERRGLIEVRMVSLTRREARKVA